MTGLSFRLDYRAQPSIGALARQAGLVAVAAGIVPAGVPKELTMTQTLPKPRRMAREPQDNSVATKVKKLSKLDQVEALLLAPAGATIAEIMTATGWQQHSVRGAMAGALRKRGLIITSDKDHGVRRYRASKSA